MIQFRRIISFISGDLYFIRLIRIKPQPYKYFSTTLKFLRKYIQSQCFYSIQLFYFTLHRFRLALRRYCQTVPGTPNTLPSLAIQFTHFQRSEERRVGKECMSRWDAIE